jgi:hypothetical protein
MIHACRIATAVSLSCVLAGLFVAVRPIGVTAAGSSCEDLRSMPLGSGRIDAVQAVGPGAFLPPGASGGTGGGALAKLPGFCRVTATLTPSSDSDIKVEVWLPSDGGGTPSCRPWATVDGPARSQYDHFGPSP